MANGTLETNLSTFYAEMEERLQNLPPEQQQYLEGLFHAFDAMTRYASSTESTPLDREDFIGSAKSWAYSRTHHLGLDPQTRMRPLIESARENVARSYVFAAHIQKALGMPLSFEQQMSLINVVAIYKANQKP